MPESASHVSGVREEIFRRAQHFGLAQTPPKRLNLLILASPSTLQVFQMF